MTTIDTIEQLEALYGEPVPASILKEVDRVTPHYAAFITASPFVTLATSGPEGLDCTPRGDLPGFVRIHDEKTLMMPDRRGNNRVDLAAQHHSGSARRAAVHRARLRRYAARQWQGADLGRSGIAGVLSRSTARRRVR